MIIGVLYLNWGSVIVVDHELINFTLDDSIHVEVDLVSKPLKRTTLIACVIVVIVGYFGATILKVMNWFKTPLSLVF